MYLIYYINTIYLLQINLISIFVFDKDKLFIIIIYATAIGLFYGPFYVLTTKCYLYLSAIDIGIIRNISLILTTSISCIIGISTFYFLYIPSILLILITSFLLIYYVNKLNNNNLLKISSDINEQNITSINIIIGKE